ncbi:SRPBCC domain-containing protein [Allorhizocola rhizosphaerae]|uniref:SRPBCC domain-containing protein n=1 Tax=Allorhizocola rhizosphaerae TaxID=1872709 RepID=UPI0013C34DAD|nr:SRPBCC domain-containing protein [Allorhizocola rhizosphaerae]
MRLEAELSHPRARVWRALTDRQLLSAWFQPVDSQWTVTPNDDLPSFAPFELELVPAEQTARLLWRWHGKDFFSEAEWELTPTEGGCRLSLRQSGFLGAQQAARRSELRDAYQKMIERLRAVLETIAEGGGALGSLVPKPQPQPPANRRVRLLSIASAVAIVVMLASATAVWITNGGGFGLGGSHAEEGRGPGSGSQPGAQPQTTLQGSTSKLPTPNPVRTLASASPTTASAPSASPSSMASTSATATYRVIELAEGGFDTEVTVRGTGWTVVLTMPAGNRADNLSPGVVNVRQQGRAVTVTPVSPGSELTFVVRYTGGNADKSLSGCTVDGQPCRHLSS